MKRDKKYWDRYESKSITGKMALPRAPSKGYKNTVYDSSEYAKNIYTTDRDGSKFTYGVQIQKTYVTDLDMLRRANEVLFTNLYSHLKEPIIITSPATYTELASLVSGKYKQILEEFADVKREIKYNAIDDEQNKHIQQFMSVLAIREHSITNLMKRIKRFNHNMKSELYNGYTKKKYKYAVNIVTYAFLY